MSSAVTPSDSACHPSDACQSRYSSGRSQAGLPPPLPPLVRSEPRFRPSVLPAPCIPSAVYAEPPFQCPSVVPRRPTPERVLSPVPANTTIDIEPIVISSGPPSPMSRSPVTRSPPVSPMRVDPEPEDLHPTLPPSVGAAPNHTTPQPNASPAAPTRANPFPASRYPTDPNDPALRELFPNKDDGVFDAIPADAVEAALVDIQGRFETILSASVLPPSLRRSTYAAFLSKIRELRRHRLQVMAVFNPSLAAYPDGNGDGPAPNSGSS
ncbi:hypothetical protein PGT21_012126 [Puccinia graminis f. sp. tritici]|uniref:Uncharacterized protein n=1 Tax=Puccinia graminis f. sp. tritici TaxID=56615 RepID=A0A5B0MTN8_PUCGR|nr:hypothetical protein PGT21_012126 [Puccinia graminis f. sp. tritici]